MSFWKDKNVLVTGAAGNIGSYLVELLLNKSANVTAVDNFSSGKKDNLNHIMDKINFIFGDLRKKEIADKATRNKEVVFDLAAKAYGIGYSGKHHSEMLKDNILINLNVLDSSCKNNVKKFLVVSSSCVYPDNAKVPTPELDVNSGYPEKANEGYGWAKRFSEIQARIYGIEYPNTEIFIVRPTNVYGGYRFNWNEEKLHVIPSLIKKILRGDNPLIVWGSGTQIRDFIHVKDVARAFIKIIEKGKTLKGPINIGSKIEISIQDLVSKLLILTNKKNIKIIFDKNKPEGKKRKCVDITKLNNLGFNINVDFNKGLLEVIDYYKKSFQ